MSEPIANASIFGLIYRRLDQLGMAGEFLRWGMHLATIILIFSAVWGVSRVYFSLFPTTPAEAQAVAETGTQENSPADFVSTDSGAAAEMATFIPVEYNDETAVRRQPVIHTTFPTRPRQSVQTYTVQTGDSVISIAEKFALRPSSILWGNPELLKDDPHNLRPGQELTILPIDGTVYTWHTGDHLKSVAEFFSVSSQSIINWAGNHLNPAELGDINDPTIPSGAALFIPAGKREFVTWKMPRITRQKPEEGQVLGSGFCEEIESGPGGSGTFDFPVQNHFLSGYDYAPDANHFGIDLDGTQGSPVTAADNGIIVYAGWNNWGYGNLIVIDHGNGWQSIYAHLDEIRLGCGQPASKGDILGTLGKSGSTDHPNLHFELMNDEYGRVNPWNFLP